MRRGGKPPTAKVTPGATSVATTKSCAARSGARGHALRATPNTSAREAAISRLALEHRLGCDRGTRRHRTLVADVSAIGGIDHVKVGTDPNDPVVQWDRLEGTRRGRPGGEGM